MYREKIYSISYSEKPLPGGWLGKRFYQLTNKGRNNNDAQTLFNRNCVK